MDYIVVIFHPFDLEQEVMVYQHGECIEQTHPCLEDTVKTIYKLNKQYHTDKIELCGNPFFINKYIRELKCYFSNIPTIEIIPR